jgi:hypothetical protein
MMIYIDYYKWKKMVKNYNLKKKPKMRDFLKIKSKNKELFNYIKYQLETKWTVLKYMRLLKNFNLYQCMN